MKNYSMEEYIEIINNALKNALPVCDYNESVVCDAMKYSIENAGKRIRPALVLEFCRICGGKIEDAIPAACAIEMIHTYSLIHDDLPCMDNDDMRRGKPSCHIAFGEDMALLAGDGLLTEAFHVISSSDFAKKFPERAVAQLEVLSKLSGANGMIGGQVIDLKSEGKSISIETLELMDAYKTGALIKASALMGVIAANGNSQQKQAAETFASCLGHAFQIVDDILDVTADEKVLGKPVGSDSESNKSTYVSILGLEKSKEYVESLTEKAINSLDVFAQNGEFLKNLAVALSKRNK